MALIKVTYGMLDTPSDTAVNISAATSSVNTVGKYAGLYVWDTTNNRLMRAAGSDATDVWWVVDGSASVAPA